MPARATGERTRGSFRRTSRGSLGRRAVRVRERAYAARRRCPYGRPASEREAPSDVRSVARSDKRDVRRRVRERAYAARRRCPHGRPASEREAPSDVRRVARSDDGSYVGSPERPSWTYVDAFANGPTRRGDDARTRGSSDERSSALRRGVRTYVEPCERVRERVYARLFGRTIVGSPERRSYVRPFVRGATGG